MLTQPMGLALSEEPQDWRFAGFEVDLRLQRVSQGERRIDIDRSGYHLLCCLLARAPAVVDKDTLIAAGWPGRVVSENSLPKAIGRLRRALGDEAAELIVSVHGYGYRLAAEPVVISRSGSAPADPSSTPEAASSPAAPAGRRRARWRHVAWAGLALAALLLATVALRGFGDPTAPVAASTREARGATALPQIAVLPFRDLSSDGSLGLLARGIADHLHYELHGDMHRLPALGILTRGQVEAFQDDGRNAADIGGKLGADIIVGGDLNRVGTRLQVELRINDLRSGKTPWRHSVEREAQDQATLIDDLTLAMIQALRQPSGQTGVSAGRGGGTVNADALAIYQRAAATHTGNNDTTSQRRTIALAEQAIALDPDYADAWLMLGGELGGSGYYADTPEELAAGRERALEAMGRGIELAPRDPWNYLLRSEMRLLYKLDWVGAKADIDAAKALAVVQSEPMILVWEARFLASMNRIDEAIEMGSRAIARSPTAGGRRNQGWHYLAKRDTRNARAVLKLQLVDLPESPHVHFYLALCDIFESQPLAALRQLEFSSPLFRLVGTAIAQHELGNRAASDTALKALIDRFTPADGYWAGAVHAWRGEADQAFEWAEYALRAGDSSLMYLPFDPLWQRLRGDPRMKEWERRLAPSAELLAGQGK